MYSFTACERGVKCLVQRTYHGWLMTSSLAVSTGLAPSLSKAPTANMHLFWCVIANVSQANSAGGFSRKVVRLRWCMPLWFIGIGSIDITNLG